MLGIVRRIDELGRVVIPKELRRSLSLKEGDELEILANEKGIVLKRFSTVKNQVEQANDFCTAVKNGIGGTVLICDKLEFIAGSGEQKRFFIGKKINDRLYQALEERNTKLLKSESRIRLCLDDDLSYKSQIICPIVKGGDIYGAMIFVSSKQAYEVEQKVVESAVCLFELSI